MNVVADYFRTLKSETSSNWNRFWFTPSDPATLCVVRIFTGSMLFYTHLIWASHSDAFFGKFSWLNREAANVFQSSSYSWSYLWLAESGWALMTCHLLALLVFALLTVGLWTRVVSVLAFLITVAYANRSPAAMFGLDQFNCVLSFYLMIGASGACYSIDALRATRRANDPEQRLPLSLSANIATRLIQLHLCVVYLFAGTSKLQGAAWWNGTAVWGAIANLEYQSADVTWIVQWPSVINVLTHMTVAAELSYAALVWHRLSRPLIVATMIGMHLGIALFLGMITFGTIMIVANIAFVSPQLIRQLVDRKPQESRSRKPPVHDDMDQILERTAESQARRARKKSSSKDRSLQLQSSATE